MIAVNASHSLKLALAAGLLLTVQTIAHAQSSPYTPDEKKFSITPTYSYKAFNRFRDGKSSVQLRNFGIRNIEQHSAIISAEYGITKDIAVDASLGYVHSYSDGTLRPTDPSDINGLSDTHIGVRWKVINERDYEGRVMPTITFRAGAILPGTYEEGFINSPGDGAFGFEYSMLLGKYFEDIGFGYVGTATHRVRESVPDDFIGSFTIYKSLFERFTVFFGYQRLQSLSGINFDSPAFTLGRFQDLNEISDRIEYGVSYRDDGGRTYSVGASNVIGGNNVGESYTINGSATFSF